MKTGTIGAALALLSMAGAAQAQLFADRMLEYRAGFGAAFTDPMLALGAPSKIADPIVPDNTEIVSLGTGGWLTLGFSTPLVNSATNRMGMDFIIFGNALQAGGDPNIIFQEPAEVWVGVDTGSGYNASTPFYRLKGSANPAYSWTGVDQTQNPTWGYADVTPTDGLGNPHLPDDPFTPGIDVGSAGGDAFDISWAVNAAGVPVALTQVNFIRIRAIGSWSPDIDAISRVIPVQRTPSDKPWGGGGSDPSILPVPEPGSLAGLGLGLIALLTAARRRGN